MEQAARQAFWDALRQLEAQAKATREAAGLPLSRRAAADEACIEAKRISDWLPEDPTKAAVPQNWEPLRALIRVWCAWAGRALGPEEKTYWDRLHQAAADEDRPSPPLPGHRSAYLQQVERIAPPELLDREEELTELAGFCLEPDGGPYIWWRAGAWAGKTALMSSFVLHPPEAVKERVRIVAFFITARLAAQDTRESFTMVLLEQLADITGQDLPPTLPEVTREAFLLDLLAQAAYACQASGKRLVLVVDGLDEDRSTTVGPDAHSIAALLPATPPAGMRIIVASRPRVPDDVPDFHPLRDLQIIRALHPSPAARDLQRLGDQEIKRLLKGTPIEQDLLGLLTAARGGLSGPDLHELTSSPLWEIEESLHTVAGRTFTRRTSTWAPDTGPEVYLLGHEELQKSATRYLGQTRLDGYRDRIHAWADTYCTQEWPRGSPEYLLRGYYRLLQETSDLPRLIACAGDAVRHDWMLDLTGGDSAALDETRDALNRIADQDTPDLIAAVTLAYHRDQLTDRNTNIPTQLPAVWVTLGQTPRALALTGAITNPERQANALSAVAGALAHTGQHQHAERAARQAEQVARSITDSDLQAKALSAVAIALAQAGQTPRALALTGAITIPRLQAKALSAVAVALAHTGQHQHAERAARQAGQVAWSISE
jgi:hypothetical protein